MFSIHGIVHIVRSDHGPPFTSDEIKRYMEENSIKHCRSTPLWPQANSKVENFMKPLTKATRSTHAERKIWKKHFHKFLLNNQTTPHCTTGFTPALLLFNIKFETNLHHLLTTTKLIVRKSKEKMMRQKLKWKFMLIHDLRQSHLGLMLAIWCWYVKQNRTSFQHDHLLCN